MIRPIFAEVKRYGDDSKPGEFIYDRPFQWDSRRIGPDLAREGGRQSSYWHYLHFMDPAQISDGSIMPSYAHLAEQELNFDAIKARVGAMAMLGVPYDEAVTDAPEMAREQAHAVAQEILDQGGDVTGLENTRMIALIAYMQRLGVDITKPAPEDEGGEG